MTFNWRKEYLVTIFLFFSDLSLSFTSVSLLSLRSPPFQPWNLFVWPPLPTLHHCSSCLSSAAWCHILLTMLLDCEHSITLVTAGQVGSCEGSIFRFSDFDITLNFLGRKVWRIIVSMWEQVFLCTWGLYIQDSWSFLNNRVKSLDSCGYREGAELIIYVLLPSPFSSHLSLL